MELDLGGLDYTKRCLLGVIVSSIFSNVIFYSNAESPMFVVYKLKWLPIFTLRYWPWLNLILIILLIINLIKNKDAKTKEGGDNN